MVCHTFTTFTVLVVLAVFLKFGAGEQPALADNEADETERIVGGKDAENGMYPYAVALYYEGKYICTGSIISEKAILTAAHCVVFNQELQDPNSFYATAGNVNRTASNVEYINFRRITVHPQYMNTHYENDLAILETVEPIRFTKTIMPICIASPKIGKLKLERVTAMGWGQTNNDADAKNLPDVLQSTTQHVISNLKCRLLFLGSPVPDTAVCTHGILDGICHGDSGGPLVLSKKGRQPIQVGIASTVPRLGCGTLLRGYIASFTRVSSFTNFITKNAAGTVCVMN